MTERSDQPESGKSQPAASTSLPDSAYPDEPFACPSCGQMLAAAVRVCVACKRPIDAAKIKRASAQAAIPERQETTRATASVRFPWRLLVVVMIVTWAIGTAMLRRMSVERFQLIFFSAQFICSVWVFYDAREKRVPKALRWGLGTMLLWIIVFPWYLARRKAPDAPCPFVEAETRPFTRALLLALLILLLASVVLTVFYAPRQ